MTKNRFRFIAMIMLLTMAGKVVAQDFAEVLIVVQNQSTGAPIAEAAITVHPIEKNYVTGEDGVIQLGLPFAVYRFIVRTPFSKQSKMGIQISSDTTLYFDFGDDYTLLKEIEIAESRIDDRIGTTVMSIENMNARQMERIPVMAGEKDLLKAAAYLPGIQTGSEGSADLLIRGGTPDQNLYLLDGARLYHSNHLFGFLSSFNPLMVSSLDIYKGGFPPRFGGKLSSIIDARTAEPNYSKFAGEGSVGLISSSLFVNVPLITEKLTLMVGGRRSYYDAFAQITADNENIELYNYHDLNGKLSWKINADHTLTISAFADRDHYWEVDEDKETDETSELTRKWRNRIYNLQYSGKTGAVHHVFNAYASKFHSSIQDYQERDDEFHRARFSSFVDDYTVKYQGVFETASGMAHYFGFEASRLNVLGSRVSYHDQDTSAVNTPLPEQQMHELNFFGGIKLNFNDTWKADIGARLSSVNLDTGSWYFPEPRASLTYVPDDYKSAKLSYARMSQSLHMLTNPGLGMPIDIYFPARSGFLPGTSHQLALGYIQNVEWLGAKWDINTEIYYKTMHNILAYRDGYSSHVYTTPLSEGESHKDVITSGEGQSYGWEFFVRKNAGKLKGFLSYTLSETTHRFDDLNEGRPFPARHDIRHNLAISGTWKIPDKWRLNASWQYKTGQAITLPLQTYPAPTFSLINGNIKPYDAILTVLYNKSERNQYRMKAFHVLNIAAQKQFNWKKIHGTLEFGLYNAYSRRNPYYYYFDNSIDAFDGVSREEYEIRSTLKSVSIFPVLPSLSVSFEF